MWSQHIIYLAYFLSKKDQVEHTLITNLKIVDKPEHERQHIHDDTSFHATCRISFHITIIWSVYFTISIYYCKWERKTDDLMKTQTQIEHHVSAPYAHSKFRYLGKKTRRNCIHEKFTALNLKNACYHLVQNRLSSHPLYKYIKIKMYKTIILSAILHGWETQCLTLTEEYRLTVPEKRELRTIFWPKRTSNRKLERSA
jgi:hypothetical protein